MAFDAADRLRALIEAGEDIPYEVHEPGDGSPLCQYEPQTEIFVRDHAGRAARARLLRRLLRRDRDARARHRLPARTSGSASRPSRASAPSSPDWSSSAGSGWAAPTSRSTTSAWTWRSRRSRPGSTSTPARSRSSSRCAACRCRSPGSTSPSPRSFAPTPSTCPPRPARATGSASPPGTRRSWPRSGSPSTRPTTSARSSRRAPPRSIPSAAWSRPCASSRPAASASARTPGRGSAGDRWRRIATGSGRHRPGGYRLTEDELVELAAFSRALSSAGTPFARLADDRPGFAITLGRALNRFEAGLERNVVLEALNDYLLALRFVLEGGGPADLGLAMRVAALCAEPDAPRRGQGGRRPRDRARARAVERRAGARVAGRHPR